MNNFSITQQFKSPKTMLYKMNVDKQNWTNDCNYCVLF